MAFPVVLKTAWVLVSVLVSVAFFTLFERKALGYSQLRKGPNKLAFKGVLQPVSDAVKLFSKELVWPLGGNQTAYCLSPALALFLALVLWLSVPLPLSMMELGLTIVFLMCVLSAGVYPPLGAGVAANSKYPLLGGLRAVAQTISYEVSLSFILFSFILLNNSYLLSATLSPTSQWYLTLAPVLWLMCSGTLLAETSRTPFDFSEGESELVSGFNTEFSGSAFALFFLAEYGSILFMSLLSVLLFLSPGQSCLSTSVKLTMLVFMVICVRSALPRLRYDKLMDLAWKRFLPASLSHLMLFLGLLVFVKA